MARERSKAGTPRRRQRRARTKTREITDIYVLASLELHNAWQVCMVQKLSTFVPLKRGLDTEFPPEFYVTNAKFVARRCGRTARGGRRSP